MFSIRSPLKKKKKVAVVVPKYGLVGGGELFAYELTERLAENGHYEFNVIANRWAVSSSKVVLHKVPILPFPKWLAPLSFAFFVDRKIKALGIDYIHTHDRIFRADLWTVHSIPHATWISEVRGKTWPSLFDRATCCLEKKLINAKRCRLLMPVSNLAKDKIKAEFNISDDRMEVINPGVDLLRFCPSFSRKKEDVRKELGLEKDDFVVLFVGMNFELKGLDQLLEAISLAQLKFRRSTIKILIVGKGNEEKYRARALQFGIGQQIIFAGIQKDIERIYQASDVFVLLSQFDTFGMVVSEAMATSLPVIVSDTVGARDLVKQGLNGFVVRRDDVNETAAILIGLVNNPQNLWQMGQQARSCMQENTWDNVAKRVLQIYKKNFVG